MGHVVEMSLPAWFTRSPARRRTVTPKTADCPSPACRIPTLCAPHPDQLMMVHYLTCIPPRGIFSLLSVSGMSRRTK